MWGGPGNCGRTNPKGGPAAEFDLKETFRVAVSAGRVGGTWDCGTGVRKEGVAKMTVKRVRATCEKEAGVKLTVGSL